MKEPVPAQESTSTGERYYELDSLRGLAAATVVFGHFASLALQAPLPGWAPWRHAILLINRTPLTVLMAGGSAVRFFFVLSGFVLMLPFIRRRGNPYAPYIVKRICRIYLPYFAALILAVAGNYCLGGHQLSVFPASSSEPWSSPVSWKLVFEHIAMLGVFDFGRFNPVLWSLVQEMRISIVYPLIAIAVLRLGTKSLLALIGTIEAILLVLPIAWPGMNVGLVSFSMTIHWASMFALGGWLALHRNGIQAWMKTMSAPWKAMLAALAFLFYSMGIKTLWGFQLQHRVVAFTAHRAALAGWATPSYTGYALTWTGDWVAAICASVAICFALSDRRTKAVLNHALVLWTGRASYTLYLVHAIVLYTVIYTLSSHLNHAALIAALYFPLTVVATIVFYRYVEVPTMKLGRAVAKRMTKNQAKA